MALPRSLGTSIQFPIANYFCGPIRDSNGNHYIFLRNASSTAVLEAWKADNGDNTWSQVATVTMVAARPIDSLTIRQHGTAVECITQLDTAGGLGRVQYVKFFTSDDGSSPDSFGTSTEAQASSNTDGVSATSMEWRSDGDLVAASQSARESLKGVTYKRLNIRGHEGTAWGDINTALDDAGTINYSGIMTVKGASDLIHMVYGSDDGPNINHKSFSSANSLSAAETVNDNAVASMNYPLIPGAYLDISGAEVIIIGWLRSSDSHIYTSKITNDGTPAAEADASDHTVESAGGVVVGCLAKNDNTDTFYLVYANDVDQDLYLVADTGSGWGAASEILDAVTVNDISANIYQIDNGDTVLAYIYDDAGTVKYNEYVLVAGSSQITHVIDTVLLKTNTTTHVIDTVLLKTNTAGFVMDAVLEASTTSNISHIIDTVLLAQAQTKTLTLDAVLRKVNTASFVLQASLVKTTTASLTLDTGLLKTTTATHIIDAVLLKTNTATVTLDTVLKAQAQTATHIVDTILQSRGNTATYIQDVVLKAQAQTATHVVDTVLKAQAQSNTFVMDAVLQAAGATTRTVTHIVDTVLKSQNNTATVVLFAVLTGVSLIETINLLAGLDKTTNLQAEFDLSLALLAGLDKAPGLQGKLDKTISLQAGLDTALTLNGQF